MESSLNSKIREISEINDRLQKSLAPFKRLNDRIDEYIAPIRKIQERLQPLLLSSPLNSSYQKTTYGAAYRDVNPDYTTPQISQPPPPRPPPTPRASTTDKNKDRREVYAQVLAEYGRYAQKGVVVEEAARRAGCSVKTMIRAISD